MRIDIDEGAGIIIILILACILITTGMILSHFSDMKDKEVQLQMAKAGYSPVEISCAYNIDAPLCLYAGSGVSK